MAEKPAKNSAFKLTDSTAPLAAQGAQQESILPAFAAKGGFVSAAASRIFFAE